jgi:hypothetical protein
MLVLALAATLAEPALPPVPEEPVLRWAAPETCPEAAEVEARLAALLGGPPAPGDVRIDATIERDDAGVHRLKVAVESASGSTRHELSSPRCEELADAVALVAAVALDPLSTVAGTAPPPSPQPKPEPEPEPAEPTPVPVPTPSTKDDDQPPSGKPPARRQKLQVGLRPELALDFGPLPRVAVGGGFALALLGRRWRIELGPVLLAARQAAASSVPEATAEVSLVAGRARGCAALGVAIVEFPLCAGLEIGALRGRGTGTTLEARRDAALWVAGVGGPGIAVVPRRFIAVVAGIDIVVPFYRPAFDIGGELVHRARPVGLRAILGVEVRVP